MQENILKEKKIFFSSDIISQSNPSNKYISKNKLKQSKFDSVRCPK